MYYQRKILNKTLSANKNASFLDNLPIRGGVLGQHDNG